ncbi:MAG: TIGR00730 family Rossman fold protein [Rhodothermales bacterium]|nr:TIGR00730 family Rossman fold protein [Rhodothermales bacterium]
MKEVAVYCASASDLAESYRQEARDLGVGLAASGLALVYGGGNVGLMGEIARSVHERGGYVAGYIPERLMAIEGRAYDVADELIVTQTMQERKRSIFGRADAFVVLAGGLGTLEEFLEVATLRKLGYHDKPIILINTGGFYNRLLDFFAHTETEGFSPSLEGLYAVVPDAARAVELLQSALFQADSPVSP